MVSQVTTLLIVLVAGIVLGIFVAVPMFLALALAVAMMLVSGFAASKGGALLGIALHGTILFMGMTLIRMVLGG